MYKSHSDGQSCYSNMVNNSEAAEKHENIQQSDKKFLVPKCLCVRKEEEEAAAVNL